MSIPGSELNITEIVPLSAGHSLEVDIYTPQAVGEDESAPQKIAVLCHPWSWLGGCKDDPVLVNLSVELSNNLGITAFVPNSRAVGNSTGRASFSGQSEAADLEELVKWCINKVGNVGTLLLVGYSYGSLIALCHPILPEPVRTYHVLLSYPLSPLQLLTFFNASTYREKLRHLVNDPRAHVFILYGDKDQFTALAKYQVWVASMQQPENQGTVETNALGTPRVETRMISGADHFWRGQYNRQMRQAISGWLNQQEQL
ncbi:alpha/beta-hydrolase [Ceratobasidium sp. AG-I]|nr:alpha/beta-hydrolase [Ceratobasidium sp. AG-I]